MNDDVTSRIVNDSGRSVGKSTQNCLNEGQRNGKVSPSSIVIVYNKLVDRDDELPCFLINSIWNTLRPRQCLGFAFGSNCQEVHKWDQIAGTTCDRHEKWYSQWSLSFSVENCVLPASNSTFLEGICSFLKGPNIVDHYYEPILFVYPSSTKTQMTIC